MTTFRFDDFPLVLFVFFLGMMTPIVLEGAGTGSDGSSDESPGPYEKGLERVKEDNYADAERLFAQSIEQNRRVAESYNMLGFSQRKQGKRLEAIQSYYQALDRKPDFPEAREYLGEAYLQGAEKQLSVLKEKQGTDHEQYKELQSTLHQLAEQFRK